MQHVLVIQLARMGDLLQTKRLLLSLAQEPGTQVHLCVDASLCALARLVYPFAAVHPLPAHGGATATPGETLQAAHRLFHELQGISFSHVYMLNASPLSFALARLFPAGLVRGFCCDQGQPARSPWARLAARWTQDRVASPLNLVDYWAHFHPAPLAPERVNPIPQSAGTGRIGVVMAGRVSRRSLSPHTLALCLQAVFQARGGPEIVCIGSGAERPLVRQLSRLLPRALESKLVDATGTTSLEDLPELLSSLDMLLTPDTGTMHLAAHLGVPVQAFFLSSAWCFETGPYGMGHKVWQATTPCAPCLESAPCPHAERCAPPFADPQFLAHLTGKHSDAWPEHLTGYVSRLDPLGVTYQAIDGDNPAEEKRHGLRTLLAHHLHYTAEGDIPPFAIETLLQDGDWILPRHEDFS